MKQISLPKSNSVHLWPVQIPGFVTHLSDYINVLNDAERQRAMRLRLEPKRARFIIVRAVLRRILASYLGVTAEEIEFSLGAQGKPCLRENTLGLHFNVSHSADFAVFAIATAEVGVDIEKIRENYNDAVARRFFSAAEYAALHAVPAAERNIEFYRLWVGKEAVIKAKGVGIFAADGLDLQAYHLQYVALTPEYQVAVAMAEPINAVITRFSRRIHST